MSTPELEAIAELSEPLVYRRPDHANTRTIGGKRQTPTSADVPFEGEIQPATPKDIRHLPEGTDARDVVVIFTGTELFDADEIEATVAGGTIPLGEVYVVQGVERWTEGEFYEVKAMRRPGDLS